MHFVLADITTPKSETKAPVLSLGLGIPKSVTSYTGKPPYTLSIDIGGTGVKLIVLDANGTPVTDRDRVETPQPATPAAVLGAIMQLSPADPKFDRVSVGFPGVVFNGVVKTAANLHPDWVDFDLASALTTSLKRPVVVCNDADMQGYGAIESKGVEMVVTLGTGVGAAVFVDGVLVPNLELGHHPFRKRKTYEELLGKEALLKVGKKKWRKRVKKAVNQIGPIWNYRTLYLGGGNAKFLKPDKLPENVKITENANGLLGGIALWREHART